MPDLNTGDPMPDTTLVDGDGNSIRLRDRLGRPLVVYFYPKDDTFGCTKEACTFRDHYEGFVGAGADVIGVSRDDAESHAKFKAQNRLPFTLLTDPGGKVAEAWNVKGPLGMPGRITFVFDDKGVLRHKFESTIRFGKHVEEALAVVKKLARA